MKVLELFAGTRSIGKAFEQHGHEVFSVEWDKNFENIDLYADISKVTAEDIIQKFGKPDVIWASPDCATFSIAAISHHRRRNEATGNLDPVSEYAKFCDEVDQHVIDLIKQLNPKFYFIENPRGGMRKMTWMQELPRYTVTYCQYGDSRMKPTDIWTNHPDPQFKPMCHNGDPCHEKAPRGSRTGTQGLKGSKERSVIPAELCSHIVNICENYINKKENETMELKVNEIIIPEQISFNYEELKQELSDKVKMYETLIYTDDQVVQAKADRASLNKLKKALNDERIRREKEYMQPFNEFKQKINEIISIIDKPCGIIDEQVKAFEEQKKQDKMDAIIDLWNSCDVPEGLTFKRIFDQKWLNASTSMKSIQEAIAASIKKFNEDIQVITELPEYSFEAKQTYISTLDLGKAIQEAHRLSEVAKKKAEYEAEQAQKAEEAKQEEVKPVQEAVPDSQPEAPAKQWIRFQALLSPGEAALLKTFFMTHDIEFKPL